MDEKKKINKSGVDLVWSIKKKGQEWELIKIKRDKSSNPEITVSWTLLKKKNTWPPQEFGSSFDSMQDTLFFLFFLKAHLMVCGENDQWLKHGG